jgi:hypothetical protein
MRTPDQAAYFGVDENGPYKAELYSITGTKVF